MAASAPRRQPQRRNAPECGNEGCTRTRQRNRNGTYQRYCPQCLRERLRAAHATRRGQPDPDRVLRRGYVFVREPASGQLVPEHRLVMERMLGRKLRKGEGVRHRNDRRDDNTPSNLMLTFRGGWTPPPQSAELTCPHCGHHLLLVDAAGS